MSWTQLGLLAVIFGAVSMAALMAFRLFLPDQAEKRLAAVAGTSGYGPEPGENDWRTAAVTFVEPFARLSLPREGWENSPTQRRFIHAGLRDKRAWAVFFGTKTALAVIPPVLLYLGIRLAGAHPAPNTLMIMLVGVAAAGYYLPNLILEHMIQQRQQDIFENFPDASDLLMVCVESGLGLDAALNRVAEEMRLKSEAMAEELQLVNLEMRAGSTREQALRNLALRTGVEEVNVFATMLVQADRFGTSIGDSLRVFSDELRIRRRNRAEETSAKVPLKLLFPLVFFIFPSLLLVLLGPAFIQIYRVLLPTMAGQ